MALSKKAVFFTISALIFAGLMITAIIVVNSHKKSEKVGVEQERVLMLDEMLRNFENDLSKSVYISGFRALTAMVKKVVETGDYCEIDDFKELVIYGTLDGEANNIMTNMTLSDWVSRAENISRAFHVNLSVEIINVTLEQKTPWEVEVNAYCRILLADSTASFERTEKITSLISVIGFEDPLYVVGTNGAVTNIIRKTPFSSFVSGNDTSNLMLHVQGGYYINSSGPSFLGRLTGNLSSSPNGIESLVYLPELAAAGISVKEKSVVDYIYFSGLNPVSYKIINMPDWFMIDEGHIAIYQVSDLIR